MATVGFGDSVPAIWHVQTLLFFIAIIGLLFMVILIAIIMGKYVFSNESLRIIERGSQRLSGFFK
jgi:hypothetical protein